MSLQIQPLRPVQTEPIIGIDLGTTNSLVAFARGGVPEVLTSREGRRLIPSVVTFTDDGPVVGYRAKDRKITDAEHTVYSVKRLLGRGFEDLKASAASLPYRIAPGDGLVSIEVAGQSYNAIEISAMILRELKAGAEAALGRSVSRAVITVPAYFNDSQRQATRAAGRLAGLDVLRIINEPTAASLAYGLAQKREGLIAVYDLGGGTFDVSILKLHDGIFEVLATNGDTSLGGDDLDWVIARAVATEIRQREGIDPFADPQLHAALLGAAEGVKIALAEMPRATLEISLPGGKSYRREWTTEEFVRLARPVIERTREPCLQALRDAGLRADELSDVVMVGGPTRLRVVQDVAREIFGIGEGGAGGGRRLNTSVHPDEVVALGAAIQADILAGNNRDMLLLDVVPLSLGIETYGGLMSPLITRNTRIPAVARETFTTFVDRQTGVDIHVLQGERERVDDNRSLARFKLKGIEPQPAGFPRVEVTFLIDADGILQVAAKDLKTGHEQSIEVRPSFGLSDTQVERMLAAGADGAEADIAYRRLVEARNDGEAVLRAVERQVGDARALLPTGDAELIEQNVADLRAALVGVDPQKIAETKAKLSQSTIRLAELVLQKTMNEAIKGAPRS